MGVVLLTKLQASLGAFNMCFYQLFHECLLSLCPFCTLQPRGSHCILLPCPRPPRQRPLIYNSFLVCLCHDFDSLEGCGPGFCRRSLNLGLSDVFLMVRLELRGLGRNTQRRSAFLITSRRGVRVIHMTSRATGAFITWLRSCSPGFCAVELLFPLPLLFLGRQQRLNSILSCK